MGIKHASDSILSLVNQCIIAQLRNQNRSHVDKISFTDFLKANNEFSEQTDSCCCAGAFLLVSSKWGFWKKAKKGKISRRILQYHDVVTKRQWCCLAEVAAAGQTHPGDALPGICTIC